MPLCSTWRCGEMYTTLLRKKLRSKVIFIAFVEQGVIFDQLNIFNRGVECIPNKHLKGKWMINSAFAYRFIIHVVIETLHMFPGWLSENLSVFNVYHLPRELTVGLAISVAASVLMFTSNGNVQSAIELKRSDSQALEIYTLYKSFTVTKKGKNLP